MAITHNQYGNGFWKVTKIKTIDRGIQNSTIDSVYPQYVFDRFSDKAH